MHAFHFYFSGFVLICYKPKQCLFLHVSSCQMFGFHTCHLIFHGTLTQSKGELRHHDSKSIWVISESATKFWEARKPHGKGRTLILLWPEFQLSMLSIDRGIKLCGCLCGSLKNQKKWLETIAIQGSISLWDLTPLGVDRNAAGCVKGQAHMAGSSQTLWHLWFICIQLTQP
jgi:hypothetical protein